MEGIQSLVCDCVGMTSAGTGSSYVVLRQVLPMDKAAEAHAHMEASAHFGKIVLRVSQS